MLARKDQTESGHPLPEKWLTEVNELLSSVYQKECQEHRRIFQVYGQTYPNELLLMISLCDPNDTNALPITLSISTDIDKNEKPKKLLNNLIDSVGIFFENYFATRDWDEYQANWEPAEFKGINFYYRVSRENITVSLMADQLLNQKDQ